MGYGSHCKSARIPADTFVSELTQAVNLDRFRKNQRFIRQSGPRRSWERSGFAIGILRDRSTGTPPQIAYCHTHESIAMMETLLEGSMPFSPSSVKISIDNGAESDQEELALLGQRLRRDIQELDVDTVEFVREGAAPAGAKGDPLTMASLAVTLAPLVLKPLFDMLQNWTARHNNSTVTIEMGSDKLTMTGSPSKEQLAVIQAVLQKHQ